MSRLIFVVNASRSIANSDLLAWTIAWAKQIREEAALAWDLTPDQIPDVQYGDREEQAPPGAELALLAENSDVAGAAGYHDVSPSGVPYERIFVDGGSPSVTGSHECLEMTWDPQCNLYRPCSDGFEYAVEASDAVESDTYKLDGVLVSNFVYDAFFDEGAPAGTRRDRLGLVKRAFETRPGGYQIRIRNGQTSTVFGYGYPASKIVEKAHPASRACRRGVVL